MTDNEAEATRLALITALADMERFLSTHGELHWLEFMSKSRRLISDRNFRGVELMLSTFGGMGSFNDVMIHPHNGHNVPEDQVHEVNEELWRLQGRIYKLGTALSRYQSRQPR